MPSVYSLPVPFSSVFRGPFGIGTLPVSIPAQIRIPLPMFRIGSILPSVVNGPLRESLVFLFNLAWNTKVQLPVLITVAFLVLDIRLQMEINVFWEPPRHNPNRQREQRERQRQRLQRDLTSALFIQRERQRRLQEELNRAQGIEQTRLEEVGEDEEEDVLNCSEERVPPEPKTNKKSHQRISDGRPERTATLSEVEDEDEDSDEDDGDDDTLEYSSTNDEDDDDDDEDDDNPSQGGSNSTYQGGHYFDDGRNNRDSDSSDNSDDDSDGGTPLVVELEISQRSSSSSVLQTMKDKLSSSFSWTRTVNHHVVANPN